MLLRTLVPTFTLLILAGQEVCCHRVCKADEAESWSYSKDGRNGPKFWGVLYPNCNRTRQSPININESNTYQDYSLSSIEFDYPLMSLADVTNNGHTVQVTPRDGVQRSLQDGGKLSGFTLSQFHFHWGAEHLLSGHRFSVEVHLVHTKGDEVAVIGAFFQKSFKNNTALDPLMEALRSIPYRGDTTTLHSFNIEDLLPNYRNFYYRYEGSLTTPPCDEGVTWTLFKKTMYIGYEQVEEFKRLHSTSKNKEYQCHLRKNYRPVQPLHDRIVTYFRKPWKPREEHKDGNF